MADRKWLDNPNTPSFVRSLIAETNAPGFGENRGWADMVGADGDHIPIRFSRFHPIGTQLGEAVHSVDILFEYNLASKTGTAISKNAFSSVFKLGGDTKPYTDVVLMLGIQLTELNTGLDWPPGLLQIKVQSRSAPRCCLVAPKHENAETMSGHVYTKTTRVVNFSHKKDSATAEVACPIYRSMQLPACLYDPAGLHYSDVSVQLANARGMDHAHLSKPHGYVTLDKPDEDGVCQNELTRAILNHHSHYIPNVTFDANAPLSVASKVVDEVAADASKAHHNNTDKCIVFSTDSDLCVTVAPISDSDLARFLVFHRNAGGSVMCTFTLRFYIMRF